MKRQPRQPPDPSEYADVPLPKMRLKSRSRSPKKPRKQDFTNSEEIASITKATQLVRQNIQLDLETDLDESTPLRFENKLLLVIDTNFVISHLKLLEDLATLHSQYGHILIVPWAVLKELDGLKNSGKIEYRKRNDVASTGDEDLNFTIGQRARLANNWLFEKLGERSESVFGQKITERLSSSASGDDSILDCCRYFQTKADAFVVILSDDKNLCTKALIHEIMTVSYKEGMTADSVARIVAGEYSNIMGEMMEVEMPEIQAEPAIEPGAANRTHLQPCQVTPDTVPAPTPTPTPMAKYVSVDNPPPLGKVARIADKSELEVSKRVRDAETVGADRKASGGEDLTLRKLAPGELVSRHTSNPSTPEKPTELRPVMRTPSYTKSIIFSDDRPDGPEPKRVVAPLPPRGSKPTKPRRRAASPIKPLNRNPQPPQRPSKPTVPSQEPAPDSKKKRKFEFIRDPSAKNQEELLAELERVVFKILRMALAYRAPGKDIHLLTSIGAVSDAMESLRNSVLHDLTFPNLKSVRPPSTAPHTERLAFLRGLIQLSADMESDYPEEYPKNYRDAVGWAIQTIDSHSRPA